jgi:hypothetical protein
METQSKLRKNSFTIVEQACHEIRGFRKLYEELDDLKLTKHFNFHINSNKLPAAGLSPLRRGKLCNTSD